jgi:hypothetical protein
LSLEAIAFQRGMRLYSEKVRHFIFEHSSDEN